MGPYEIVKRDVNVAYELNLANKLSLVNEMFHVFMLKKFIGDPIYILSLDVYELMRTFLLKRFWLRF